MKKTIIFIISFFLFLLPFTCIAFEKDASYVFDEAKILKDSTKDYINVYSEYLKQNLDIEYYVIAIDKVNSDTTLAEYTDYIYKESDIEENSLLIVISKEDREIRIKAGSELSQIVTNEIINDYLNDYFIPYLKTDEWDKGIKNGYSAFFKLICNSYEIDSEVIEVQNGNTFINKNKSYIILAIVWITSIFSYIYSDYLKRKNKKNAFPQDTFLIISCLILNTVLLIISYYVMPLSLIVVLLSEIILVMTNVPGSPKVKSKKNLLKERKRRIRGKKDVKNKRKI